jgi:hypothetical protein
MYKNAFSGTCTCGFQEGGGQKKHKNRGFWTKIAVFGHIVKMDDYGLKV